MSKLHIVGPAGLEPATYGLKVRSSTIELEAPAAQVPVLLPCDRLSLQGGASLQAAGPRAVRRLVDQAVPRRCLRREREAARACSGAGRACSGPSACSGGAGVHRLRASTCPGAQ